MSRNPRTLAALFSLAALLLPDGGAAGHATTGRPLHITGRVLQANELRGFSPKKRAVVVTSLAAWKQDAPSGGIDVEARLRHAGFVAAIREELAWTGGSGRGALSVVVRLSGAGVARVEIGQQVRDFAGEPARGGALTYTPFAVPGIPGAHGFTLTAKDGAGHNVIFADGPFTYHVGVGWGPQTDDPPTRAELIGAAARLYARVHGRPTP